MSDVHNEAVSASSDAVIVAEGLTKRYGSASAVDDIGFAIRKGEVFGLLGPNGAGKTTTILMLLGLTEISSGRVSVLGFDPARQPLEVKGRAGYLPDSVGFYDHLTAEENLAYTAKLMGLSLAERTQCSSATLATSGSRPSLAACASGSALPKSLSRRPRSPFWTSRPRDLIRRPPSNSST
jgi:ABC-2 type transport system ATP-binding protein